MSVVQAARLPRLTPRQSANRVPGSTRTSPVNLLLTATRTPSFSPKRGDVQPRGSNSSNSTTSVNLANLPGIALGAVLAQRDEGDMDKAYESEEGASPRSGTPSDVSMQLESRKVELQDFELIRVVGKGCAGRVLMVRHAGTHRIHAMKAISKRSVLATDELGHTLTELSILRKMCDRADGPCRFVSRLDYAFTDRDNFYFVMHFYPGGDLATQMEMHGALGRLRTMFYVADIVQGLEEIHRNGIIVRDLKPENILLDEAGHAVLADFGLAKEFSYRGEPMPIHVQLLEGERTLPWWAGKGLGSKRIGITGNERIMYDRAESFVGTTEYLAPEVVQRMDYSYAVDWWGLGCIMFECLVGRVPFKLNEEEDLMDLWKQITEQPWTAYLEKLPGHPADAYGIDEGTYGLLDALLTKDPMRRITEPCIKQHGYFSRLDWDTVRLGEYEDPYGLRIRSDPLLNTRYFPKLCLEEPPSVDMSRFHPESEDEDEEDNAVAEQGLADGTPAAGTSPAHQEGGKAKRRQLTALNDYETYLRMQALFRRELESFYYVSDDMWDGYESGVYGEAGYGEGMEEADEEENDEEEESSFGGDCQQWSFGGSPPQPEYIEPEEEVLVAERFAHGAEVQVDSPALSIDHSAPPRVQGILRYQGGVPGIMPRLPTPDAQDAHPDSTLLDGNASLANKPAPLSPLLARDADLIATPALTPVPLDNVVSPISMTTPHFARPLTPPMTPINACNVSTSLPGDRDGVSAPTDLLSDSPTPLRRPVDSKQAPSSPVAISPKVRIQETLVEEEALPRQSMSPRLGMRLPSGLPASGLSTSDMVSVPSLGTAQNRIVRRNPHLAPEDMAPARLSVEVHGHVTRLDDDDWEAVDVDTADIPSLPNGTSSSPGTFLSRLRRKPSVITSSRLRRGSRTLSSSRRGGHKSSDSGSSRVPSPTKGLVTPVKQLFGKRNLTLTKFRAFPKMKSKRGSASDTSSHAAGSTSMLNLASPSAPVSPTRQREDIEILGLGRLPERPPVGRRHTESGWFDKLRRGSRKVTDIPTPAITPRAESAAGQTHDPMPVKQDGRTATETTSDQDTPLQTPARRSTEPGLRFEDVGSAGDAGEGIAGARKEDRSRGKPENNQTRFLLEDDGLEPLVWEYGDIEVGGDVSKLL